MSLFRIRPIQAKSTSPLSRWITSRAFTTSPHRRADGSSSTPHGADSSVSEQDRENQTFILPDGRTLGFAEYGPATGRPLLFFHGFPSSRIEAEPLAKMAHASNIRVIALERPGFGLSSPQPGRRIVDWPADVAAFAEGQTGLKRYAVMGLSGGGPYALACVAPGAATRGAVTRVGLFASGPPWEAGARYMSFTRRVLCWMANRWPSGLGAILMMCVHTLRRLIVWPPSQKRIDAVLDAVGKKVGEDVENYSDEKRARRREHLLRILANEPFRQGAAATVWETKLLSAQDWGFRFEDVDFDPVRIWHGAKDANSPVVMMRYLAGRLPHGELTEFADDTHYTMFPHVEGAMEELVSEEAKQG